MAAWSLSEKEWDALDRLRFGTSNAAVFRNATIILMSATGRSKTSIANDLGCSVGTVDIARRRYRQSGSEGLIPGKPIGRVSRATPNIGRPCERLSRHHRKIWDTASVSRLADVRSAVDDEQDIVGGHSPRQDNASGVGQIESAADPRLYSASALPTEP